MCPPNIPDLRLPRFALEDLDGVALVRVWFPARVDFSGLAPNVSSYLDLVDENTPAVRYADLSLLEEIDPEFWEANAVFLRRIRQNPGHLGGAWVVGNNVTVTRALEELFAICGTDLDEVFTDEWAAIDYLHHRILDWRESGQVRRRHARQ